MEFIRHKGQNLQRKKQNRKIWFLQKLPYLLFLKNESFNKTKHKMGSESLMLGSRGAREHEGRFKGLGKKTPLQTILFSLFHPSLKPQIWAICVTLSISSSDKGLIARSSVGQCHVKINQSQSIKKAHIYKSLCCPLSSPASAMFCSLVSLCNRLTG